ncbi:thiamine biosynthesis protein ThiF [Actinoplanes subtropicus]|uniref:thiamine biosynthesis protein ThiF n=1 Tax=Actinoplanes subtropicus TaxID=543632 RepID=UPI0004C3D8BF|nr:thiamine biosynthesis protein ThiF [Actinoplanes subtropicus]
MNRPTLIPGLPRVWRRPDELQLGSDPARALLLHLPDPRYERVLDLLDGTRSERLVMIRAAEFGVPADECRVLLDALAKAGLILPATALIPHTLSAESQRRLAGEAAALALHGVPRPAQVLRRRAAARVVISGHGRLGAPIAVALAQAGVGDVQPEVTGDVRPGELAGGPLLAGDVGRSRRAAIIDARSRSVPKRKDDAAVRAGVPFLLVQLDHDEPTALRSAVLAGHRRPHLAVTVREGVAVIGPLVPAAGRPCLNCLDLHRRERDAGWPGRVSGASGEEPCTVATLLAATAYAVGEVLSFLDGDVPQTMGATAEVAGPGRVRRRSWAPHPECPCAR